MRQHFFGRHCSLPVFLFALLCVQNMRQTTSSERALGVVELPGKSHVIPQTTVSNPTPQRAVSEQFSLKELTAGFQKFISARAVKEQTDTTANAIIQTRFLEKIVRLIAQSCRLNVHEAQFFLPHPVALQIVVLLNRSGMIEKAFVSKTSGFFMVDQFILSQFYDASNSFPRLPSSIVRVPYKMLVQIDIPSGIDRPYYFKVLVE